MFKVGVKEYIEYELKRERNIGRLERMTYPKLRPANLPN